LEQQTILRILRAREADRRETGLFTEFLPLVDELVDSRERCYRHASGARATLCYRREPRTATGESHALLQARRWRERRALVAQE